MPTRQFLVKGTDEATNFHFTPGFSGAATKSSRAANCVRPRIVASGFGSGFVRYDRVSSRKKDAGPCCQLKNVLLSAKAPFDFGGLTLAW